MISAWFIGIIGMGLIMSVCSTRINDEPLWFEFTDDSAGWYKGLIAILIVNAILGGMMYYLLDCDTYVFVSSYAVFAVTTGMILWKVSEYIIDSSDDNCNATAIISGGRAYERWNMSDSNMFYLRLKMVTGGISPEHFKNGTVTWARDYCSSSRGKLIGGLVLMLIFMVPVLSMPVWIRWTDL